jgi:uncharacterized protein YjdB
MRETFQKVKGVILTSLLAFSVATTSVAFPLSAEAAESGRENEQNVTIPKEQLGGYITPLATAVPMKKDPYAKSSPVLHDGLSADDFWSKMSSSYYGSQLTGNAKTLYDNMEREAAALMTYDGDLASNAGDAEYSGLTTDEAMEIAICFEEDHPQYFFMWGVTVSYYEKSDRGVIHFSIIGQYQNGKARSAMKEQLKNKITEITSAAEKEKTVYDKEKLIHDYIVKNTSYDTASDGGNEQKMDSALINGKSVCAGYASAFQALCNKVGIETIAVTSTSHKWVEVRLGGKWYAVDVTWDDPIGGSIDTVSHQCFNISDAELLKIDAAQKSQNTHKCNKIWDDTFKRPQCVSGTYDPATATQEDPKNESGNTDTQANTEPDTQPDTKTDTEPDTQPDTKTDTDPDTQPEKQPHISYRTHVQNIGWQGYVSDGALSGTTGQALRLEAMNISLDRGNWTGGIEYRTHVQNIGWQDWKKDGELTGTQGQALRLEAIQIRLTGEIATKYDIYYCVHAQNYGWLNWAKNGGMSGTAGYAYRLEAIKITLVPKGNNAPEKVQGANIGTYYHPFISYRTHVQNIGWQGYAKDGELAGTTGQSLRLEGLNIRLDNQEYTGDVVYSTHVQNIGWQKPVKDDTMAGTQGQSLRLEAVTINLTGDMAEHYDVYYRTHIQNIGWTGWAKNGAKCGSEGMALRLEGLEVKLVPKEASIKDSNQKVFYKAA